MDCPIKKPFSGHTGVRLCPASVGTMFSCQIYRILNLVTVHLQSASLHDGRACLHTSHKPSLPRRHHHLQDRLTLSAFHACPTLVRARHAFQGQHLFGSYLSTSTVPTCGHLFLTQKRRLHLDIFDLRRVAVLEISRQDVDESNARFHSCQSPLHQRRQFLFR